MVSSLRIYEPRQKFDIITLALLPIHILLCSCAVWSLLISYLFWSILNQFSGFGLHSPLQWASSYITVRCQEKNKVIHPNWLHCKIIDSVFYKRILMTNWSNLKEYVLNKIALGTKLVSCVSIFSAQSPCERDINIHTLSTV